MKTKILSWLINISLISTAGCSLRFAEDSEHTDVLKVGGASEKVEILFEPVITKVTGFESPSLYKAFMEDGKSKRTVCFGEVTGYPSRLGRWVERYSLWYTEPSKKCESYSNKPVKDILAKDKNAAIVFSKHDKNNSAIALDDEGTFPKVTDASVFEVGQPGKFSGTKGVGIISPASRLIMICDNDMNYIKNYNLTKCDIMHNASKKNNKYKKYGLDETNKYSLDIFFSKP